MGSGALLRLFQATSLGAADLKDGLSRWRIWILLGGNNLRQRYARSKLGQYWIVLGTAISTTAYGLLWSQLWGNPIEVFLPYVAIGHICWALITGPMLEGIGALSASSYYFVNQKVSISTIFYSGFLRNLLIFMHNFLIVIVIWLIFGNPNWLSVVYFIPGLLLVTVTTTSASVVIGLISVRFRDLGQIIASLLQIAYFVSPVMWNASVLPERFHWVVDYNPIAQMLMLLREPLIGVVPEIHTWFLCSIVAAVSVFLAMFSIGVVNRRIIYWV